MSFTVRRPRSFTRKGRALEAEVAALRADVEERAFALTDMLRWGYTGLRGVNLQNATEKEIHGIPALNRAARIRAEAVASLRLRCWSGEGPERVRRDSVWQARLFDRPANECQSRFAFWETIGESLAYRNNAFVWKNVDPLGIRDPIPDWWALHPDQVQPKGAYEFKVTVDSGYVDPVGRGRGVYEVGPDTLLHIRGHGNGGTRIAPTLVELFRMALTGPVARQQHEARMWRRGTSLQLGIEFPEGVSKEKVQQFEDIWRSTYEGADGETTAVIGGGGTIKPIGMTAADAQFVEMANLTVQDASLIMGVPENLLRQTQRPVPNLEQDVATWLKFGLGPDLERIESALLADQTLFGGAQTYPRFDTDLFVRGDVKTEAQVLVALVQAGIITPNEARAMRGMDDLGEVGDVPQITPVGGAPNPIPLSLADEGAGAQRSQNGHRESAPVLHEGG